MTPAIEGKLAQGCGSLDMAVCIPAYVPMCICCNRQVLIINRIASCCSLTTDILSNVAEYRLPDKHPHCVSCPHMLDVVLKSDVTEVSQFS